MEGRKEGMRTLPDGFNGAVMAVESISDAMAFLHGPGGCRVRQMVHSTAVFPREDPDDVRGYFIPYFNGYPRVPATYLDEYDYINGAFYKVVEGLDVVNSKNPELVVIVNSPGAALIGDNHEKAIRDMGLQSKVMYMDESLVSMPMTSCYGHMLRAVLEFLEPSRDHPMEGTFILLGMTVLDKDWRAATEELSGLLESMGLKFICAPGAGASTTDLVESVNAEFAVVVSPESCEGLTEFYSEHGVKVIRSPGGAPVGFDAVESWLRNVADITGTDPSSALEVLYKAKDRVYEKFVGMKYNALRIKGMTFSAAGVASIVRPLTEWLYSYLAMAPVAVKVDPGADPQEVEALAGFLQSIDYSDSMGLEPKVGCGAVFCEGIQAYTMQIEGSCRIAVPIGHSSMGLDDIIPRPIYGIQGALFILDEILHGVRGS